MLDSASLPDLVPLFARLGRLSNRQLASFFKQHGEFHDITVVNHRC